MDRLLRSLIIRANKLDKLHNTALPLNATNKRNKSVSVAFLSPYPLGGAPSQRFRYEQYLPCLTQRGISYAIYPFLDHRTYRILYSPGHTLQKVVGLLSGFLRRIIHVVYSCRATYVFIHREAAPVGPPGIEWFLAKVARRKIIYDFDDAIWLTDPSHVNPVAAFVKWPRKVAVICQWSHTVSAGNAYLADFARHRASRVIINPTTIDTVYYHNRLQEQATRPPVVGWTGSHSTLKYLDLLVPVLQQLQKKYDFQFLVIADRPPVLALTSLAFVRWQQETEIDDLLRIHVGLMPLPDDAWAKGKCGFKALQYLALGIPALVSPVGVNTQIVEHNIEGYHCTTEEDWYRALEELLTSPEKRSSMGQAGRKKVVNHYSVEANTKNFLSLFGP